MAAEAEECSVELSVTASVSDLAGCDTRVTVTVSVVNTAHVVAVEDASNAAVSVVLWVFLVDKLAIVLLEGFSRVSLIFGDCFSSLLFD